MRRNAVKKELLPILFLFALTVISFHRVFFFGENYIPADLLEYLYPWKSELRVGPKYQNAALSDVIQSMYPSFSFMHRSISRRRVPMWNPHQSSGAPFAANCGEGAFYPFNAFFLALFPPGRALGYLAAFHVFISGFFMYLLLRYLGARRVACVAAAVVFMYAGPYVCWRELPNFNNTVPWIPLMFLFFEMSVRRRRLGAAVLTGAVAGVQMLAGNLQTASFSMVLLGFYALYRCYADYKDGRRVSSSFYSLAMLFIVVAAAVAVALIVLAPTAELFVNSHRTPDRFLFSRFGRVLSATYLGTAFAPDIFGNPSVRQSFFGPGEFVENCVYVGLLPVSLFFLCVFAVRDRLTVFFQGLAALMVLFMTGSPVYRLYYCLVPGAKVVSALRFASAYAFAISVGAGLTLNVLMANRKANDSRRQGERFRMAAMVSFAAAAASLIVSLDSLMRIKKMPFGIMIRYEADKLILCGVLMVAVWALLFLRRRMAAGVFGAAAVVLILADLFRWGFSFNPSTPQNILYPETGSIRFLKQDKSLYRINSAVGEMVMWPNSSMVYSFQDVRAYDSLYYFRYYNLILELNKRNGFPKMDRMIILTPEADGAPLLDFLGVKYYLAVKPMRSPYLRPVYEGDISVYRNLRSLPRANIYETWKVASERKILDAVVSKSFRPAQEVFLEEEPRFGPRDETPLRAASVRITDYSPGFIRIAADTKRNTMLAVSENLYPGWRAVIDGKPVKILRANYSFMGIALPAGRHTVALEYAPAWAVWAAAVSLAAAICGLLAGFHVFASGGTGVRGREE